MHTHHEKRHLPYKAQDIFAAIADIETYPDFLPWCAGANILTRRTLPHGEEELQANMTIRFKVFRERFRSQVTLIPKKGTIKIRHIDGPFKYLDSEWKITPHEQGSNVEFFVKFQFRNQILQRLIGLVFYQAMHRIISAFETRLADLYPCEAS